MLILTKNTGQTVRIRFNPPDPLRCESLDERLKKVLAEDFETRSTTAIAEPPV